VGGVETAKGFSGMALTSYSESSSSSDSSSSSSESSFAGWCFAAADGAGGGAKAAADMGGLLDRLLPVEEGGLSVGPELGPKENKESGANLEKKLGVGAKGGVLVWGGGVGTYVGTKG
jgi:hypothetical protein